MEPETTTGRLPDSIHDLMRGELSALDTYKRAIELTHAPLQAQLLEIYLDHWYAVDVLRGALSRYDAELPASSGVWGAFSRAADEGVDHERALQALKEGEERRVKEYRRVLFDLEVDDPIHTMIDDELLRLCADHVPALAEICDEVANDRAAEEVIEEATEQAIEEAAEVAEATEQAAEEVIEEATEEVIEEATEQASEEATEQAADQQPDDTTGDATSDATSDAAADTRDHATDHAA